MIRGLAEKLGLSTDTTADRLTPQVQMGVALAKTKRPGEVYADTVPYAVVQRRRAANRRARASRRANRGSR